MAASVRGHIQENLGRTNHKWACSVYHRFNRTMPTIYNSTVVTIHVSLTLPYVVSLLPVKVFAKLTPAGSDPC